MKKAIVIVLIGVGLGAWYFLRPTAAPTLAVQQPEVNPAPKTPSASVQANKSEWTATQMLEQGLFKDALAKLEATPVELQNKDWRLQHIRALDGLGRREEGLKELGEMLEKTKGSQQNSLLILQSNMLMDEGKKDLAGDVLYKIFSGDSSSTEAQEAAYKLKDLWKPWLEARDRDLDLPRYNKVLSFLLQKAVDDGILKECYELLTKINTRIFFGPKAIEGLVCFHTVKYGENLSSIAKSYDVAPARLSRINGLKSDAIRANQHLRVIKGRARIVVDKRRFNMDVYINGYFYKHFGVGIGKSGNTPSVITTVSRSMARNPPYTIPETGELVGPEDVRNPIGTRWIALDIGRGYGIHGTREPETIGTESSNGCVRLINEHVEELYDFVMVGDEVEIR